MSFFKSGVLIENSTSTASSGGTLTLTASSLRRQFITGTLSHNVKLPVATLLSPSRDFIIINRSTDLVTVQYQDATTLTTITPGSYKIVILTNNSTANGVWDPGFEFGTGSGFGVNYIKNSEAEAATTFWNPYADAAGTSPVDGTGGSPNVTWTRTTTNPLRNLGSFLLTKDAANRQGQGVSTDFTIDRADLAKGLWITGEYEVVSGTYANGDLTFYVIEDVGGTPVVRQPAGYVLTSRLTGTTDRFAAFFQATHDLTKADYRLCIHVASTSTSAYVVKFDDIRVGPQFVTQGVLPVPTTTRVFTSGSGTYNLPTTYPVTHIRVRMIGGGGGGAGSSGSSGANAGGTGGTSTFGSSFLTCLGGGGGGVGSSGIKGSGGASTALPSGVSGITLPGGDGDPTGNYGGGATMTGGSGAASPFGGQGGGGFNSGSGASGSPNTGSGGGGSSGTSGSTFSGAGGGAGAYIDAIIPNPASSYSYSVGAGGSAGSSGGSAGGSGVIIVEEFYLGANVVLSSDADPRVLRARVSGNATGTISSSFAGSSNLIFPTRDFDYGGFWNAGIFTVSVPGSYSFNAQTQVNFTAGAAAGSILTLAVGVSIAGGAFNEIADGHSQVYATSQSVIYNQVATTLDLKAGDRVVFRLINQSGALTAPATAGGVTNNYAEINKQGNQAPTALGASVVASYHANGAKTASTAAPIDFDVKDFDSHGLVTTGAAWKFTAQEAGTFDVAVTTSNTSGTPAVDIYVDGVKYRRLYNHNNRANDVLTGTTSVRLLAGQYLDIRPSANITFDNDVYSMHISIKRVGNY